MRTVDGREFECKMCGKCCKWEGVVVLKPSDIKRLSVTKSMDKDAFLKKYAEHDGDNFVLKNKEGSTACVFLNDNDKCSVFSYKPKQCADFPKDYDKRCPGFGKIKGSPVMSNKFAHAIKEVKKKLANSGNYEKALSDGIYRDLNQKISSDSVVSIATGEGIDHYLDNNTIKVASLDDLFSFDRVSKDHLIHKCTKDLWQIDKDADGNVQITRLFDGTGDPIKG